MEVGARHNRRMICGRKQSIIFTPIHYFHFSAIFAERNAVKIPLELIIIVVISVVIAVSAFGIYKLVSFLKMKKLLAESEKNGYPWEVRNEKLDYPMTEFYKITPNPK